MVKLGDSLSIPSSALIALFIFSEHGEQRNGASAGVDPDLVFFALFAVRRVRTDDNLTLVLGGRPKLNRVRRGCLSRVKAKGARRVRRVRGVRSALGLQRPTVEHHAGLAEPN